jgi:hypothetical protein
LQATNLAGIIEKKFATADKTFWSSYDLLAKQYYYFGNYRHKLCM